MEIGNINRDRTLACCLVDPFDPSNSTLPSQFSSRISRLFSLHRQEHVFARTTKKEFPDFLPTRFCPSWRRSHHDIDSIYGQQVNLEGGEAGSSLLASFGNRACNTMKP